MKLFNVAILGATGAVGQTMLNVLEERDFPLGILKLLASGRSSGKKIHFREQELRIEEASDTSFEGMDFVLGAVDSSLSQKFASDIVKAGAIFIDNSSAFRLEKDVPLVIPEVNGIDVLKHRGIIANPNCVTIIALTAIASLHQAFGIKRLCAATYQAVSGAGVHGIHELKQQIGAEFRNEEKIIHTFPYQIAYNVIPQIGEFEKNGYTSEELKLQEEGRKILHASDLKVSCTCVRLPVYTSHSVALEVEFEKSINLPLAKRLLDKAEGIKLVDVPENKLYPLPLSSSNQDLVLVGRVRKSTVFENGIALFCCGDQLRKGAATNAIQIMEEVIRLTAI